jgi:DNA-binding response OmpR family regulator
MKILLVEDDHDTAEAVCSGLGLEGHEVTVAGDVESALRGVASEPFDIAVLDLSLPSGSGYDVLEHIRSTHGTARVLILTARGRVADRVEGLDRGADDFLVKPFSFIELAARLRALGRRRESEENVLHAGALRVEPMRGIASVEGRRLELTPLEFKLLACLMKARGSPLHRKE